MKQVQRFAGGFAEPPVDAAHAFRGAMTAMARPGEIRRLAGAVPPAPLSPAAGALVLTLCDVDTVLHLAGAADCEAVRGWVAFHTGAPVGSAEEADFALGRWADLQPVDRFRIGTSENPDRSATLIVEMPELVAEGAVLIGPGIREVAHLNLPDAGLLARNAALFPLGFDCFFTCGDRVAGLPRSTHIMEG
ncbi:phosphonate C-P lyase system protein PhnH [Lutimaribacter marinistellae]|uniref:Phosphonate C-P lyase system protein PhnH n=1 Tax=Lutimaribacter marinistellae TaxID=1820329 RepID=A0ABV7TGI0_9RHOB